MRENADSVRVADGRDRVRDAASGIWKSQIFFIFVKTKPMWRLTNRSIILAMLIFHFVLVRLCQQANARIDFLRSSYIKKNIL